MSNNYINNIINKFICNMNYLNNNHVVGILFYGSYLTGLNTDDSDIDLHIIFDNDDPLHLIRGNQIIDGIRIEYFEKTLDEVYRTIDDDYNNQNNASLIIFGKSKIIYSKDDNMNRLQEYVNNKYSINMKPLSDDEIK